jgi:hypothetical protein
VSESRIRPVVILPVGEMAKKDIKKLNDNGICVVEAKDPSKVRFADPPPEGYSVQERAAIELFRILAAKPIFNISRGDMTSMYVDIILKGMIPTRVEKVERAK